MRVNLIKILRKCIPCVYSTINYYKRLIQANYFFVFIPLLYFQLAPYTNECGTSMHATLRNGPILLCVIIRVLLMLLYVLYRNT